MSCHRFLHKLHCLKWVLVMCGIAQCCACGRSPATSGLDGAKESNTEIDAQNNDRKWDELQVEVTGNDFQWQYRYPGRDNKLRTDDDRLALRNLHLPARTKAKLILKSGDYLYTYAIPEFDKQEIAVSDMTFNIDFVTREVGTFEFRGDQFCGFSHPQLSGQLVVESDAAFNRWLESLDTKPDTD